MPLEIDRRKGERCGNGKTRLFQLLALPVLRCRIVDLENADTKAGMRVAQRKCIEARPEHDDLPHAARDAGRQRIFRETAARCDEQTERPQRRVGRRFVQSGAGFIIENPRRKWIAEDSAAFQRLMDGTIGRCSARGVTWLSGLHVPPQTG